jgi:hypothetical protein
MAMASASARQQPEEQLAERQEQRLSGRGLGQHPERPLRGHGQHGQGQCNHCVLL